ncbi:MAG: leucine-rich repeat protein [Ruminococcus sp.]|nr:leucine-rich repeat protein [Ruminococcus sp.]
MLSAFPINALAADSYDTELQEILDSILIEDMTGAEKVEAIAKYVGETYTIDGNVQTYDQLLQTGGGDCWATTDLIVHLADLAGMRAVYHDASRDPGPVIYGFQHICAQILVDGEIYLADAGFTDDSMVQYYIISLGDEPYRIQENNDDTVSARTYAGFDTEVVIPETLGGKTVTKIGNWAFQQWQLHDLNAAYFAYLKWEFIRPETVTLPDTITEIGKGAFYQNDLHEIYLPVSLILIGENAFYDCTNLTDIYYSGTEEQWRAISIADGNESLENVVIHYQTVGIPKLVAGDVNMDDEFTIADVILLQKWLLAVPDTELPNWKAGDLCADDRLDVFDLCLMKRELIATQL